MKPGLNLFSSLVIASILLAIPSSAHADEVASGVDPTTSTAEAGVQSLSKDQGTGAAFAVTLGPPKAEAKVEDKERRKKASVQLKVGPQLQVSAQVGKNPKDEPLRRADAQFNWYLGAGALAKDQDDSVSANANVWFGVGGERNLALDRPWRGHAHAGIEAEFGATPLKFRAQVTGEVGVGRSGDKTLPYAQVGGALSVETCPLADRTRENEICGVTKAGLALGLLQVEAIGSANVEYRHWLADRMAKLYLKGGIEGIASADLSGGHSAHVEGIKAGIAF